MSLIYLGLRTIFAYIADHIGRVAEHEASPVNYKIATINIFVELHSHSKMTGHIYKGGFQTYKVAHKMREKNSSVLAVAIGIEQALLAKEWTVATPYLVVKLIVESCLNPI